MQIIRFADLKAVPSQPGGGSMRELARHPAAAAGLDWDWRVDLTDSTKAGEMPPMPGRGRVLTVADGELLLLTVDGQDHPLERYRPFRFPADVVVSTSLPTGDVRHLSVLTRRDAFKGYTSIIEISKKRAQPVFAGQFAVLLQGQATVGVAEGAPETLGRYDAVAGADEDAPEILGRGFLAIVSIDPVDN